MTAAGPRRRRGRLALGAAALAFAAGACVDLGTGVDGISYLEFDGIPWPSLIAGDTMRDSTGAAAPLRASAYDASGHLITGAAFQFVTLDTGVAIDAAGFLRSTGRRDGTVRVVAIVGGLQTDDRTVRVTRRPDSVFAMSAVRDTLLYAVPDAASNLAEEMRIRLVSADSTDFGPGVGGWLVRWRTVHGSDTLSNADTAWVVLQSTTGARRAVDTTGTDGSSGRRLRVFGPRLATAIDSFIVLAEVRRHGVAVAGSPVRFVLRVAPQ